MLLLSHVPTAAHSEGRQAVKAEGVQQEQAKDALSKGKKQVRASWDFAKDQQVGKNQSLK